MHTGAEEDNTNEKYFLLGSEVVLGEPGCNTLYSV